MTAIIAAGTGTAKKLPYQSLFFASSSSHLKEEGLFSLESSFYQLIRILIQNYDVIIWFTKWDRNAKILKFSYGRGGCACICY